MVKVILGLKGTGKTKLMASMVNEAVKTETGSIICIEQNPTLTYDIDHSARLIDAKSYDIEDFHFLKGFISGLYANNYDLTHVFVDSLLKIVPFTTEEETAQFLAWLEKFSEAHNVSFTIMISQDPATASEDIKKYC